MNRFFKTISITIVLALVIVVFGIKVVQALRDWAAPPALPYGLMMQATMASVEQNSGQPDWAIYRRFGVIVVYNPSSSNDRVATIHAIYNISKSDLKESGDDRRLA